MTGIMFAFFCLGLTAVNDFTFKLFARKERSKGLFVAFIGLIWLFTLAAVPHGSVGDWRATILWGCVSGLFSAGGNILLIEAMSRESAGLCSLIYRLNMAPVVIGATLLLHETPNVFQYAGIILAVGAIILFQSGGGGGCERRRAALGLALVIAASAMRAAMGLSYKYGFLHGADRHMVTVINSFFWIAGGIIYAMLKERAMLKIDKKLIFYSLISGILVAGIVTFMALSLYHGNASVVIPIAQMSFIATAILGRIFLRERFGKPQAWALICGLAAVALLSIQSA